MLKFDIRQGPPTLEQIQEEKDRLERALKSLKIKALMVSLAVVIISCVVFKYYEPPGVLSTYVIGPLFLILLFAFIGDIGGLGVIGAVGIGIGCALGSAVAAIIAVAVTEGFTVYTDIAVIAVITIGLVSFSLISTAVAIATGNWIKELINHYRKQLTDLTPLPKAALSRCPKVIELCRQDELCERYRLAVARQDRPLIVAEADMIEDWAKNTDARQEKEAQKNIQLQEEACRLLQAKGALQ